ncbi:MAG: dTDP-4-dehydrorhamnose 3,5-epimerase [Chlamydiia bacterium]|nr:dTDP-4-dehydrorhamnose 3,5-epimerase [Chlamydiia bacterium]
MQVDDLGLTGLKKIVPRIFRDERGLFLESYRQSEYSLRGIPVSFVQDNVSLSVRGTVRALHFQSKPGQAKLVSCIQGKIWDVAVDIRPLSPTFGEWEAVELDDIQRAQLFIPVGFAHGFCVLSDQAIVLYKVSAPYDPSSERSIRWNDPDIGIQWPLQEVNLSIRDQTSPFLREVFL